MSDNKRIFYACRRAGIAPPVGGSVPAFTTIRGLQSAGITTTFRLEQVFELGQLAIYDNIEGIPDIEVTLEKVMDGFPPAYLLATQRSVAGPTAAPTLVARAPAQCILGIQIFDETLAIAGKEGIAENVSGVSGTDAGITSSGLQTEVHMSGLYVSSVRYQLGVERNVTEGLTLVGNNKVWVLGTADTGNYSSEFQYGGGLWDCPWTNGSIWGGASGVYPAAGFGSGGVARRQDILMDPAQAVAAGSKAYCILPLNIPGVVVSQSGTAAYNLGPTYAQGTFGINPLVSGQFPVHVQTWNVHTDLGREQLHELGRLGTYYRYVNWPVEVVNEIGIIATSGDMISASEEGIYTLASPASGCGLRYNLQNNTIRLALCEGLIIDCGDMNKLRSVGMTGGDTGRGNVEITYTYSNFNEFSVSHPQDPIVAIRP